MDFPIFLHPTASPVIEQVTIEDSEPDAVGLAGGSYEAAMTWRANGGLPYWFEGDITVEATGSLTIEAGAHFKMNGSRDLHIYGDLVADGADDPIVFTSYRDDSRWGDTNGDGETSGVAGDWGSVALYSSSDGDQSRLVGVELWYAGRDSGSEDWALVVRGTDPLIEGCTIGDSDGGVYIADGAAPDLGGGARDGAGQNRFTGFVAGGEYAVRNATGDTVYAMNNSWGVDSGDIPDIIYDQSDDSSLGAVLYSAIWSECTAGEVESCGASQGVCSEGTRTCSDEGLWGACSGDDAAEAESCDGVDNDCDGVTDEGLTQVCGQSRGECEQGVQTCSEGSWGACEDGTAATSEGCDGADNDCDGLVDEALYRSCGSDTGDCVSGQQACLDGGWGDCEGGVSAVSEGCGDGDEDCDGDVDEGLTCSGGTSWCADVSSDTTWTLASSPYTVTCDVDIDPGATLTIEPGVTVVMEESGDISVYGGLWAEGTADDPITFLGEVALPSTWGGIYFDDESSADDSSLAYVIFQHGGRTDRTVSDYPLLLHPESNPALSELTFEDNRVNGVAIGSGNVSVDIYWDDPGVTYITTGDLVIETGAVLWIDAGMQIKMGADDDIVVDGGLVAEGTEEAPIVFTSYRDDSRWGDTEGEGTSAGAPGDWGGIYFASSTTSDDEAVLEWVEIYYGGANAYAEDAPLRLNGYVNPTFSEVTLDHNLPNAIWLDSGTYDSSFEIHEAGGLPYFIPGDVTVGPAATLTIEPGVHLYMDNVVDLYVEGELQAVGTEGEPIIFTSYRDDSLWGDVTGDGDSRGVTADWGGISFESGASDASTMRYVELRYGGVDSYGEDYPIRLDSSVEPALSELTFVDCSPNGIGLNTGTWSSSRTLLASDGVPYMIDGDITVANGTTLTIEPGAVLKFGSYDDLVIEGDLVADGDEAPIVFTSFWDDSAWGDSDNYGDTRGIPEDWGGVYIASTADGDSTVLRGVELRYGGDDSYASGYALVIDGVDPLVEGCVMEENAGGVLLIGGAEPDLGGGARGGAGGNTMLAASGEYAVVNDQSNDVYARYNYWGSDDSDDIDAVIWDVLDDSGLGQVVYDDYLECVGAEQRACGSDEGECVAGTQTCTGGAWGPCSGEVSETSESCDELDNDCDGSTDEGVLSTFYADSDEDGYGDADDTTEACEAPEGFVSDATDCDDGDSARSPGEAESCDAADNNCDGTVDEGCECVDGEERSCGEDEGECVSGTQTCSGGAWGDCEGEVSAASESCDELDNDCDGSTDEGVLSTFYADGDEDGYGDADDTTEACEAPEGFVSDATDCDDGDADVAPGAEEICDGVDDDCDDVIDEDCGCEDGATRSCDSDVGECEAGLQTCSEGEWGDCEGEVTAALESCDELDNDCDGSTDEGVLSTFYADSDEDGYGDPDDAVEACEAPGGYTAAVPGGDDCDDGDADRNPAANETCDGVDEDCDDGVDEALEAELCDLQQGVCAASEATCGGESGYLACDELVYGSDYVAEEDASWCDGLDNDCDGAVDELCSCTDGETQSCGEDEGECVSGTQTCSGGAWGDCEGEVSAASESCDELDNDCDGSTDEGVLSTFYADGDEDGYGDADDTTEACEAPEGFVSDATDCDDGDASAFPGAEELCDGVDNSCDGTVDEGCSCEEGETQSCGSDVGECEAGTQSCVDGVWGDCRDAVEGTPELCDGLDNDCDAGSDEGVTLTWYSDGDEDGYGDPEDSVEDCEAPEGYVADATDCDDGDDDNYPDAVEICDGEDNDCDSVTDEAACGDTDEPADTEAPGGDSEPPDSAPWDSASRDTAPEDPIPPVDTAGADSAAPGATGEEKEGCGGCAGGAGGGPGALLALLGLLSLRRSRRSRRCG